MSARVLVDERFPVPPGYVFDVRRAGVEIYRADDGTSYHRRLSTGRSELLREWFLDGEGRLHRSGGLPANICWDSQGYAEAMEWYVEGRRSRLDGPACVYVKGVPELWFMADTPQANRSELLNYLRRYLDRGIAEREVRHSVFGPLLTEGVEVPEIVHAASLGIVTVEGVRAFREGSPVGWVRAFEAGQVSTFEVSR